MIFFPSLNNDLMNIPQQGTIMDHQDINFCIDYKMAILLVAYTIPRIHYPTSKTIQHLPNKSHHFKSLNQDYLIKHSSHQNNTKKILHNYSSKTTIMVLFRNIISQYSTSIPLRLCYKNKLDIQGTHFLWYKETRILE